MRPASPLAKLASSTPTQARTRTHGHTHTYLATLSEALTPSDVTSTSASRCLFAQKRCGGITLHVKPETLPRGAGSVDDLTVWAIKAMMYGEIPVTLKMSTVLISARL